MKLKPDWWIPLGSNVCISFQFDSKSINRNNYMKRGCYSFTYQLWSKPRGFFLTSLTDYPFIPVLRVSFCLLSPTPKFRSISKFAPGWNHSLMIPEIGKGERLGDWWDDTCRVGLILYRHTRGVGCLPWQDSWDQPFQEKPLTVCLILRITELNHPGITLWQEMLAKCRGSRQWRSSRAGWRSGRQSLFGRSGTAAIISAGRLSPQQAVYKAANCPFLYIYPAWARTALSREKPK